MNLSDLFGGGGAGNGSPATNSVLLQSVTNSIVTSSPAVLMHALFSGDNSRSLTIKTGTTTVAIAVANSVATDCIPINCGGCGIVCQNGITVTCTHTVTLNYRLI